MKFKLYIFALLALTVVNCTREHLPELVKEDEMIIIIRATIPQGTRVAYNDTTLELSWESGDQILLAGYDADGNYIDCATFNWSGGNNFTGTAVACAETYKAYYPATVTLDANGNVQPCDAIFWQQTQNGNGTTGHLRNKLLLFDEVANPIGQSFNLVLKSSLIRFNLKGVSTDIGTLNNLSWTVETETGVFNSMTLNLTGVTHSSASDSITAFLAFDPAVMNIAAGGKVKITLLGNKSYYWWSSPVANEKTYDRGNRYKATVNSGWEEIINPLSYVAEYNVNPAGNGFVTDSVDCNVSGYFTWSNAVTSFNTNNGISGYHLPSREEWCSVVPQNSNLVHYVTNDSFDNQSETVIIAGNSYTMTSDYRNQSASNTCYALRYKGTDMVSAWKYEHFSNGNNSHMKVTSCSVAPSITINDISKATFWSSGTGNDVVRYFPYSGNIDPWGSSKEMGTQGYFWSSTAHDNYNACHMLCCNLFAYSGSSSFKTFKFTVRLFANP